MKLTYEAHSVSMEESVRTVELDGQQVDAKVPSAVVEFLGPGYTHTFRFTNQEDVAQASQWVVGQEVTFELVQQQQDITNG